MGLFGSLFGKKKNALKPADFHSENLDKHSQGRSELGGWQQPADLPRGKESTGKEIGGSGARLFALPVKCKQSVVSPVRVSVFDQLISSKGLERGTSVLLSGGAGSGKTTFGIQSLYFGALAGEKGIYISTEEDVGRMKSHMLGNFGWDLEKMEQEGKLACLQFDPIRMARNIEGMVLKERGEIEADFDAFELPFKPDRVVFDSLSALSVAFENKDNYRTFIHYLFERFNAYDSVNLMLSETEQNPNSYSRLGIEEFLSEGVVVLYNLKIKSTRQQALEILKLRSSKHEKKIIPFSVRNTGIEIFPEEDLFSSNWSTE